MVLWEYRFGRLAWRRVDGVVSRRFDGHYDRAIWRPNYINRITSSKLTHQTLSLNALRVIDCGSEHFVELKVSACIYELV